MKINLQFGLMCDLLFFFFLQVLLKLRFLGKNNEKKQNKNLLVWNNWGGHVGKNKQFSDH